MAASSDEFSAAAARDNRVRPEQPIFTVFVRALDSAAPCAVRGDPPQRIRRKLPGRTAYSPIVDNEGRFNFFLQQKATFLQVVLAISKSQSTAGFRV